MKDSQKAFPRPRGDAGGAYNKSQQGMDLRDYFAIHAKEKDIIFWRKKLLYKKYPELNPQDISMYISKISREEAKYAYADKMMEVRNQSN